MQIAVLLKLVSQSTFMDSLAENVKDRLASGQLVINPADEYALELALRLRDRCNGSKVTVVTMSPACAEQVLYETLAMGADEAVHICDSAFAASDTLVTARILASALKKLPPQDMILCGQRSIDSETGHIGAQLAVYLEKPVITNTLSVWRDESDVLHLTRLQDNGVVEICCGNGSIITICRGTEVIRIPSIMGKKRAREKTIAHMDSTSLAIDHSEVGATGSPTRVVRARKIRYRSRDRQETDDVIQGVQTLLRQMRKE